MSGLLLVGAYVIYVVVVYYWKRILPYPDIEGEPDKKIRIEQKSHNWFKSGIKGLDKLASTNQFLVFLFSIAMISLLSWLLVNSAVGISEALGIPELLIGITIVAVGTSVPDLISSMIVARQGRPGMAINNAVGSNVFDILIGLGLPFLLYVLIYGEGLNLITNDLVISISILMASSVVLILFFLLGGWRTSRKFGIILILLYAAYVLYVTYTSYF